MASATVTLRVNPQELQILDEALRLYGHTLKCMGIVPADRPDFKTNIALFDGDPRRGVMAVQGLRKQIGLK